VGAIFPRHGDSFVPMREQRYEAEDLLQALIAEHPEVLAEDESGERSAWVLVKREAGVADSDEGADRWSLDHLFLDQQGVPTLVEVKRSSDTRARREVVAQMLDYAANATAYWKVESLRTWFEAECERQQLDPQTTLSDAFGIADSDVYWETVKTNLAAERIRLVFVADEIAPELRSIIEFLNRQMSETEVIGIEVRQYVDAAGQRQTIVPRVLGRTEAARAAKSGGRRVTVVWDEQLLLDKLALQGEEAVAVARSLIEWAKGREDVQLDYGRGAQTGSVHFRLQHGRARLLTAFTIWTDGTVAIPFEWMQSPFFDSRSARAELRRRINEGAPAADLPPEPPEQRRTYPSFRLSALADEQARQGFLAAIEWAFDEARRAHAPGA
jgi:hypothetical protein